MIAESKSKTDRYDARMLAELLRTNFLPESWDPPTEIWLLRGLIRQRYHLINSIVMNKNRIRHLLFQHGIYLRVFNIASPKARPEIRSLCLLEVTPQTILKATRTPQKDKPFPTRPNQWWGIDMIKAITDSGWAYMVLVKDWHTKKVVGHYRGPTATSGEWLTAVGRG